MSIKLGNNNADKIYIDNHPIREILYGDKIRYLRNDYSKNYFDVTNYETSRWEMDNKPNEYVVHLDKYIGNYENVIVPTNMYDTSYHDSWQLTVIQQPDSIELHPKIYSDSEKTNLIASMTFSTHRPKTSVSQTVTISGYTTVWLVDEGGDYGMEDITITGGTFTPDPNLGLCSGGSITKQSDSVTFSYYED